ncbi:MAG: M56 family metallopeptidase [Bacteroidota bacterium]
MKPILLYLLQVIICSGLLYGYYHLLLRNKKFHRYNRHYLLAAAAISMLVPFLNIPVYFSSQEAKPVWLQSFNDLSSTGVYIFTGTAHSTSSVFFTWNNMLIACYAVALLLLLYRFVSSVRKIRKMTRTYQVEKLDDIYFINTEEQGTPFSFFRWLFWNKKIQLDSPDGQQIFRHELFHIKQKHSRDIIFMEILSVVFWINPFFHLIKKELTTIHEFLADQFAVNENEKWNYAELLLMHLLGSPNLRLTHPFFHNQIKRRIAMITSSQKPKYQYFRKILVLPLLILIAGLFAFTYRQKQETNAAKNNAPATPAVAVVEEPMQLINVALTDTPGEVRSKRVKEKDDAVIVEKILFDAKIALKETNPLYVIDGVVISKNKNVALKSISPEYIQSVRVVKDKEATAKYGPDAADGVIEIITKKINEVTLKEVKGEEIKEVPANQLSLSEVVVQGYASKNTIKEVPGNQLSDVTVQGYASKNVVKGVQLNQLSEETVKGQFSPNVIKEVPANQLSLSEVVVVGYATPRAESEPAFPGGKDQWVKFLQRNLNSLVPVDKGAPAGKYTVYAQFIVDKEGNISDIKALTQHGFGMEEEVIRVLKTGPKWIPGKLNGETVKAFKKQPVTFVIEEEPASLEEVVTFATRQKPVTEMDVEKLRPIYPNPASNNITIPFTAELEGAGEVRVQDTQGKMHLLVKTALIKGLNNLNVSIASLPKGIYVVSVTDANKNVSGVYKLLKG